MLDFELRISDFEFKVPDLTLGQRLDAQIRSSTFEIHHSFAARFSRLADRGKDG